ncbi:MAG: DNA translocase FtsK [Patescibacteria group bacterium]|nr:DNA translocase FtsK [Patescibacteria group bacterium]
MPKNNKEKQENLFSEKHRETFKAIFSFALAIILFLALFDLAGLAGHYLALVLKIIFGKTAFSFPLLLLLMSWLFFNKEILLKAKKRIILGLFLVLIIVSSFFSLFEKAEFKNLEKIKTTGGYLGTGLIFLLEKIFAFWGSFVILLALASFALFLILEEPFKSKINFIFSRLALFGLKMAILLRHFLKKIFARKEKPLEFRKKEIEEELIEEKDYGVIEAKEEKKFKILKPLMSKKVVRQKIELPLDLLSYHEKKAEARDIEEGKYIIKKTLENFGIEVEMGEVKVGPTVTQYTLRPHEGIKLSQITSLANDLALALAAHPIRIEAPIPGKSLVGIEVPNRKVAIVSLREILESEAFKKRASNLTVALGQDVAGHIWLADLGKMPHLLISGATGSGKTVMINTIITTLLYENSPEELRFILIDPKRVELVLYNDIPHLLCPVITKVEETISALKWAISEMERRFDLFAQNKSRDIESHNKEAKEKVPYIIIIIDELADLMVAAAKEIESSIIRLAQMARATGIHLILATQRPSVDIITGLIKANITSRIAFSVASMTDSRTILDFSGAEKLLGRGDLLFISPQLSKPKRLQGAYVSDEEIKRVVEFLRNKAEPEYLEEIINFQPSEIKKDEFFEGEDELLSEAREVVMKAGRASATLLQRYLRIGYARAARLLDLLEQEGTIGPPDGARPRQVFKKEENQETENL